MTEEQEHNALAAYRHLTRAAAHAEAAGFHATARKIRGERAVIDQAIATAAAHAADQSRAARPAAQEGGDA